MRALPFWVLLALHATAASAQDDFIETARAASARYHKLESAIAAGYRKIGPDLPNMGEHWIQPRHAVKAAIDPAHPSVLTYLRVNGNPVLTGVAYTVGVQDGEEAPPSPVPDATWHFHSGAVEEEILGGMHHAHDGFRLGMIHAWVWTKNPDGIFAADNWGLSFQRLGLPIPDHVPPAASKALYLLDGGVEYYARLIDIVHPLDEDARIDVRRILTSDRVAARVASETPSLEELSMIWRDLWSDVRRSVGEAAWEDLRILAE